MTLIERLGGTTETAGLSIARNLASVLNARRGYAAVVEVFGLGEHDVFAESKPRLDGLIADMLGQVRRFEPRLSGVTIDYSGREGSVWALFRIQGDLADGGRLAFRVRFHVVLRNVVVTLEPGVIR